MAVTGNSIYITHIEKQGPFIKVWGQLHQNLPLLIKKSLLQLTPQFDQGHNVPPLGNIYVGNVLYCAKFVDGAYYRVRVTKILLQQNLVEVHFIDFGNKDVISVMNLRLMPNDLAEGPLSTAAQAKDFILANITHNGPDWDPVALTLITNEIRFLELTYIVVNHIENFIFIKLYRNSIEDYALSLFNRGVVLSIALNVQHMILQNTASGNIGKPITVGERQTSPPVAITNHSVTSSMQPPTPTFVTYKGTKIEPGTEYNVYVSYVCDGPCQFSIQLQKSEDNLARLMKELNSMELQPLDDFPMPGTVCVARCLEDDHICRAVVTNMVESQYKVFYVDFGNTEVLPIENIFQIPFKYVIPKVMATRYALAGLDNSSVTVEMKCAFKEFVCDKLLRMQAQAAPAHSALPLCSLFDENNVNVLDILQRVALLTYPESMHITRGFSQEVHVSYVHSCSHFYVQIKGKELELMQLMTKLQSICANGQALQSFTIGLPCCALFLEDGQWYRAQIINIEGSNIRVRYVDFGNEALIESQQLIKPPGEVVTALRPQAIECCLNGYQNMEDDLERDNILEQLILEKDFTMKVIEMQGSRALVDLIDSSRYNVGSLLLDQLANAKSQFSPILIQENHQIEQRKKETVDEFPANRKERKPLRDQNEKGVEKQDLWRQSKPSRKDEYDKPRKDSTRKSRRDNTDSSNIFDTSHKDKFDQHARDNFIERNGINKDSWADDECKPNWKSDHRDGFNKNSGTSEEKNWRSNQRNGVKKDSWSGDDSKSRNNRDGFKKDTWDSKLKDDSSWSTSEKKDWQNTRFQKFEDSKRKPRDRKQFSGGKKESWEATDVTSAPISNNVKNPVPFTTKFSLPDVLNRNEKVILSWFHNPTHFFCQLFGMQIEFKSLMEDIQNYYCNIKPVSAPVGASVIALFPDDSVLYRARILEVIGLQYRVQYIDFGNVSTTDKVWPIEMKFMKFPAQALPCGLSGIIPVSKAWSNSEEFSSYFNKDYYYCQFISLDNDNYSVELNFDGIMSVSNNLIKAGLAQSISQRNVYDPSILLGQQIKVIVRDAQTLDLFSLELPNGTWLLCSMHNLGNAIKTFEDRLIEYTDNFVIMYVNTVLEDKVEVTLYDTTGTKLEIIEPDEGAIGTVEMPCPLPILYSEISGFVPHVETLENNLKIAYIQSTEYADNLAVLLENMYSHYDGTAIDEPSEIQLNAIYAVYSSDTNWYRGIVKSIDGESVVIHFSDYGNSETVHKSNIRKLSPEFYEYHTFAIGVSAAVDESFIEQNVTATIWSSENGWHANIELMDTEEGVVESNDPISCTLQTVLSPPVSEHSSQTNQDNIILFNDLGNRPIEQVGVSVVLSHIDSPNEFYLQQSDALDTIYNLQATLQVQATEFPNLDNPSAGILCAAPYSIDQHWYRAQILDADEDITTVRFVDFGNTDVISNDNTHVKTLPPELLCLEQYARRSSLMVKPTGSEWNTAGFEYFQELKNIDNLTVEIIHQDEKSTYVQLYANGVDVAEVMIAKGLAAKLELETESSCTGYVSNLNSPCEFWIQLENSVPDLEWIAEQLSAAGSFPELEDSTPGSLCAALFPDDEMWYRARILSNTVAGIEVLFLDYGNSCTCISLRQLPEDLIMLQPLAQKCSLEKPMGILQWGQHANEEFRTISADGATIFNVDKISTGETCIVRLLLDGEDISKKLLPVTEDVYISHLESVSNFWVHKQSDLAKLGIITETLSDAHNWPQYEENQGNFQYVAALCSNDETWYRASIVSKSDSATEVLFIDYGNVGKASEIRLLSCDLQNELPVAIKCRLEPLHGCRWSDDATKSLIEINNEGSTLFQVEFVLNEIVHLYLNGSDVRLKLEYIPVSSAQNSPKRLIPMSGIKKPDTNESIAAAESLLSQIDQLYDKEINDREKPTVVEKNAKLDDAIEPKKLAVLILSEIEENVNQVVDKKTQGFENGFHSERVLNGHNISEQSDPKLTTKIENHLQIEHSTNEM